MKKLLWTVVVFLAALAHVPAITVGYTTAPLLSEEPMVWDTSRTELYGIGFPTPIGGIYVSDAISSSPFRWYFDLTAGLSEYWASADDSLHGIRFFYSHQEIHYFLNGNPSYFIGAGFEYIYMVQDLPDAAIFTTYTSTHGAPVACIGTDIRLGQASLGLKYTHRLVYFLTMQRFGIGELSVQFGLNF